MRFSTVKEIFAEIISSVNPLVKTWNTFWAESNKKFGDLAIWTFNGMLLCSFPHFRVFKTNG